MSKNEGKIAQHIAQESVFIKCNILWRECQNQNDDDDDCVCQRKNEEVEMLQNFCKINSQNYS